VRITAIPYQTYVALRRARAQYVGKHRLKRLYGSAAGRGDLVFDIGANVGEHVELFREIGCRVVALEPQPALVDTLRARYGDDPDVTLLAAAAGPEQGVGSLQLNTSHFIASMSAEFRQALESSGRFGPDATWTETIEVPTTTLDELIALHGTPALCKIDVEGFEREVLGGLSQPIPAVLFEWTHEVVDTAIACVNRLAELGSTEFALCPPDRPRVPRRWLAAAQMAEHLRRQPPGSYGDLYARAPKARA
jgi:FkbM family methyltransferase